MVALVLAPRAIEQLFMSDEITGMPRETDKHLGSLGREMFEPLPARYAPFGRLDEQVPEIETL
jgi:hypothetical protein